MNRLGWLCAIMVMSAAENSLIVSSEPGRDRSPSIKRDFTCSVVRSKGLEFRVCDIADTGGLCQITQSLRWENGWSMALRGMTDFEYSFYGAEGRLLRTDKRLDLLTDDFRRGLTVEWTTRVAFELPEGARYVAIEYPGTGLVTKRISLFLDR